MSLLGWKLLVTLHSTPIQQNTGQSLLESYTNRAFLFFLGCDFKVSDPLADPSIVNSDKTLPVITAKVRSTIIETITGAMPVDEDSQEQVKPTIAWEGESCIILIRWRY